MRNNSPHPPGLGEYGQVGPRVVLKSRASVGDAMKAVSAVELLDRIMVARWEDVGVRCTRRQG